MCWSGEASAVLGAASIATVVYVARQGESKLLWVPLFYAALMEILQAYTYQYIDQCHLIQNQIATFLGFAHIGLQCFFINAACLYFIPEKNRLFFYKPVALTCFVFAALKFYGLVPVASAKDCTPGINMVCGKVFCSVSGNWHIAWEFPYKMYFYTKTLYAFPAFFLPLFYGSWRASLYLFVTGPPLAMLTTNNINEWPAVWCLFSIALIFIVIKTPVRRMLHVRNWYGIPYERVFPVKRTSKKI